MKFDPEKHHRHSIRLKNYDYSQAGAYFVTIDIQNRDHLLGNIVNGEMVLNDAGKMIDEQWNALKERFPSVDLDIYQIMPDHFHGIIVIVGATLVVARDDAKPTTLGDIIGAFKSITTHEYIKGVENKNWQRFSKHLWQRNYYEHVVRDENDLERIRKYIQLNPSNWNSDCGLNKKGAGTSPAPTDLIS